jgi:hypothetical protein
MRTPLVPSTQPSPTAPAVEIVDSEQLDRVVHYLLIKTTHRGTNKAFRVEAHDLDVLADLIDTARRYLRDRHIPTGLQP